MQRYYRRSIGAYDGTQGIAGAFAYARSGWNTGSAEAC